MVRALVGGDGLGARLLVAAVGVRRQADARRPGAAQVPVLVPRERKRRVGLRRLRKVRREHADLVQQVRVAGRVAAGDGDGVGPVAVVVVVVVVEAVAEVVAAAVEARAVVRAFVAARLRRLVEVAAAGHQAAPGLVVEEARLFGLGVEERARGHQNPLRDFRRVAAAAEVVGDGREARLLRDHLAREVGVARAPREVRGQLEADVAVERRVERVELVLVEGPRRRQRRRGAEGDVQGPGPDDGARGPVQGRDAPAARGVQVVMRQRVAQVRPVGEVEG
mmetsp:Transcript_11314/g.37011  ORF Transcript_11314/g.37011 Transcript_11314/m.37011 type:complete len:279 (-) Transcript_11314:356-1192(-)